MTRFSEVYQIILRNQNVQDKLGTYNNLLGWYREAQKPGEISVYINGKRPIQEFYSDAFIKENGIINTVNRINDSSLLEKTVNKNELKKELLEWLQKNQIEEISVKYLEKISDSDLPQLIACALYLAITCKNTLPNIVDDSTNTELISEEEQELFRKSIWQASQQEYFISHQKGRRFANLNIIEALLPKGYIEPEIMDFHFDCSNDTLHTIDDICNSTDDNIAITGEGGIGKTTFLQKILERSFGTEDSPIEYSTDKIIPFFIELNRCPRSINEWFESKYNKTNFITRCIADSIQHLDTKYRDYNALLTKLENEFRTYHKNQYKYLLLLDGFNEVRTDNNINGESVRAILSNEIAELKELPNIRIITTSRVTQSAFYAAYFTRVHLNGLVEDDIVNHLKKRDYEDTLIGQITTNANLMKCLSVPLFLYMFSYKNNYDNDSIPETYGEILYSFFHKDGNFYNIRKRSAEAHNNPFGDMSFMTELILDFIVPYIAWYCIQNDAFSISKGELIDCIYNAFNKTSDMSNVITGCPLSDFCDNRMYFREPIDYFKHSADKEHIISNIISCIHNYLGIIYSYETTKTRNSTKIRYSFVHHHFRDYFSAIWNVNTLRLLPYIDSDSIKKNGFYLENLFDCHWSRDEYETIGQILQEHRNKPVYLENLGEWELPEYKYENQDLLTDILDYCRESYKNKAFYNTLLQNIINTLNICRGELSGVCFDKLDLSKCIIHNLICSKKGRNSLLKATFNKAKFSLSSILPSDHLNSVTECHYTDKYCITMDQDNSIKVWDIVSGNQVSQYNFDVEHELPDYESVNFIRISADNKLLAVKVQLMDIENQLSHILVFDLTDSSVEPYKIELPKSCRRINDFVFRESDNNIIILADNKELLIYKCHNPNDKYAFVRYSLDTRKRIHDLYRNSNLFLYKSNTLYILTYDLNLFEAEFENLTSEYDTEDSSEDNVLCKIMEYTLSAKKEQQIYEYKSAPFTRPAFAFIAEINSFIIFDETKKQLQLFDCEYHEVKNVLSAIISDNHEEMPSSIHSLGIKSKCCYIMYPEICYKVLLDTNHPSQIIENIKVPELDADTNTSSEILYFMTNTAPTDNRFLLSSDSGNTYEWHSEFGSPAYKYNARIFDTVAIFKDNSRDLFFLVHQQNGVSFFSQGTCKLVNSYCFSTEEGYLVLDAAYSQETGNLFLLFVRGKNSFVQHINIDTSESKRIFSSSRSSNMPPHLCVSNDGLYVLINDQKNCYEYSVIDDKYHTVYEADSGEMITEALYNCTLINIGISRAVNYKDPYIDSVCEIYERSQDETYEFKYGYYLPTLDEVTFKDFIHKNHDLGTPCSLDKNNSQDFWITKGFYAKSSSEITNLLHVETFSKNNNSRVHEGYMDLPLYCMIFAKHNFALDKTDSQKKGFNSYSYLSADFSEVTFINDYQLMAYYSDYKHYPKCTEFDYKDNPELAENGSKYWDFALPISNSRFICCAENYRLFIVNGSGKFISEIEYVPGLSICGCSFFKANMDEICRETVESNGGITRNI